MSNFEPNAVIRGFQLTIVGSEWHLSFRGYPESILTMSSCQGVAKC